MFHFPCMVLRRCSIFMLNSIMQTCYYPAKLICDKWKFGCYDEDSLLANVLNFAFLWTLSSIDRALRCIPLHSNIVLYFNDIISDLILFLLDLVLLLSYLARMIMELDHLRFLHYHEVKGKL